MPFPTPEYLPQPGIKSTSLVHWQVDSFTTLPPGKLPIAQQICFKIYVLFEIVQIKGEKQTNSSFIQISFLKRTKFKVTFHCFFSFSYCLLLLIPFFIAITKKSNSHYSISSSMSLHLILPSNTVTIVICVFIGLCSYPNYKELSLIIIKHYHLGFLHYTMRFTETGL